jgi:outer membrane immunogenic protein
MLIRWLFELQNGFAHFIRCQHYPIPHTSLRINYDEVIMQGINEKRCVMNRLYFILAASLLSFNAIAEENSWTGFYVGGNLGYAEAESKSRVTLGGDWSNQLPSPALQNYVINNSQDTQSPNDANFGFQAGYDYQLSNKFVIGLEVDYNKLNLEETRQTPFILSPIAFATSFAFTNKVEVRNSYSLRPKIGYAFDNTLAYVTAGVSWTSAEFSSELLGTNGYSKAGKNSKTLASAIWGIGVEHKFLENVSAKLEYLKITNDDASYTTEYRPGSTFVSPAFSERFKVDLDYDVIRAGINYRF